MPLTRPKAAQINFDITNISDPLLRFNSGQTGTNDKDAGFIVERGDDTNVGVIWDESTDSFAVINTDETGSTSGDVTISSYADLTLKKITQSEQQYTTSNMMKFNQIYTGASSGSYFSQNEYQKIMTITPAGNSENYQISGRIMAQSAGSIQTIHFNAALRSGDPLPDLSWSITYTDVHNGTAFFKPQLWTKETTTAGFIIAIQKISGSNLYGTVTVDIDVIPRTSAQKANVVMNTTQNSEQTTVDTGFTANDMTKIYEINNDDVTFLGTTTLTSSGTELSTDTTPQLGGDLDGNGYCISIPDSDSANGYNSKLKIGDSDDLQLYTTSYGGHIYSPNGNINLTVTDSGFVRISNGIYSSGWKESAKFDPYAESSLRYNGSLKFATTGTGVEVTGNIEASGSITLTDTDAGSTAAPSINLYRNSASPAAADYLGEIDFQGESSTGIVRSYAQIKGKIADPTNGTEDGTLEFWIRNNGSNNVTARMNENGILLTDGMTLKYEGATNDSNETTLTVADPTADRTITLPDATGTVVLQDSTDTLSNKTLASPTFSGTVSGDVTVSGYIKASKGIVQTVHNSTNVAASGNPVNTWSEINSNYRVSITPRYSDSRILGTFHIPMNPTGATNILMAIQPWYSTNGGTTKTILAQGNTGVQGSRHNLAVSWFRSNNGYDVNDMQNHVVHFYHDPGTTSTVTYGWYFRSEGSNTTYFNHSNGNNATWGWIAPQYLELRELRT